MRTAYVRARSPRVCVCVWNVPAHAAKARSPSAQSSAHPITNPLTRTHTHTPSRPSVALATAFQEQVGGMSPVVRSSALPLLMLATRILSFDGMGGPGEQL